jgi:ubiquinone/menaquinone biosynthesis C-methylase UbiE
MARVTLHAAWPTSFKAFQGNAASPQAGELMSLKENSMNTSASSQRFDKIATNFATSEVHMMSPTIKRLHELLQGETTDSVCDIACGAGHLALSFSGKAKRIVCVDPAPNMLAAVSRMAGERGVAVETVQSPSEILPFDDTTFDVVVSRLAPHHFQDIQQSVNEMSRVARRGGVVAVIDLEGDPDSTVDDFNHELEVLHDPTHFRSHTAAAWRIFFETAGLTVETLERQMSERPTGVPIKRWCEIASSGEAAERDIRNRLEQAPAAHLEALGIRREGSEFLMPIRTVLVLARKK